MRKTVKVRRLAYGWEASVTSLFGCCARRETRHLEVEKTEYFVSTESDEFTPREEGYSGEGTNGFYALGFCYTQQAASIAMIAIKWNEYC